MNSVVVVQGEKPVGIITTKDSLVRGFEYGMPVTSIKTAFDEAARIMKRSKIKHLPVVDGGKLVGILSDIDILFAMPNMLSTMEEVCHQKQ